MEREHCGQTENAQVWLNASVLTGLSSYWLNGGYFGRWFFTRNTFLFSRVFVISCT